MLRLPKFKRPLIFRETDVVLFKAGYGPGLPSAEKSVDVP